VPTKISVSIFIKPSLYLLWLQQKISQYKQKQAMCRHLYIIRKGNFTVWSVQSSTLSHKYLPPAGNAEKWPAICTSQITPSHGRQNILQCHRPSQALGFCIGIQNHTYFFLPKRKFESSTSSLATPWLEVLHCSFFLLLYLKFKMMKQNLLH